MAGKYTLEKELDLINDLDLMITMDSANMHLASFTELLFSLFGEQLILLPFLRMGTKSGKCNSA